jgi:hypothetical protein
MDNITKSIQEYDATTDDGGNSYVYTRTKDIGVYIVYSRALDVLLTQNKSWRYYTKDKKKFEEYSKILDEKAGIFVQEKISKMNKAIKVINSEWSTKKGKSKSDDNIVTNDDE